MADLKLCPFCESDKLKIEMKKKGTRYFGIAQLENYTASVRCNACHARGGTVSGYVRNRRFVEAADWLKDEISIEELERRAIESWNTRKPMKAVEEKLKYQVEQYRRRAEEHKDYADYHARYWAKKCSYEHALEIVRSGTCGERRIEWKE